MTLELVDRSISRSVGVVEDVDFLLEETNAFLAIDDEPISSEIDDRYYDSERDILLLEEFLNDDPSSPPIPPQELKVVKPTNEKSSIDEPPVVELKDLPPHLEYAFLEGDNKLPIIIVKDLKDEEKIALIKITSNQRFNTKEGLIQKSMRWWRGDVDDDGEGGDEMETLARWYSDDGNEERVVVSIVVWRLSHDGGDGVVVVGCRGGVAARGMVVATRVDHNLLNDFNMATNGNGDDGPPLNGGGDLPVPDLRTMEKLCQPTLNGRGGPIASIAIQATNFGLKNDMIQQVQNYCQFHGLSGDDANKHLDKFLHVTQSIKVNGVTDDALRLYLSLLLDTSCHRLV
nr:reverse transcriptase domain-containing protein [Tanacetum cinerariifolium]